MATPRHVSNRNGARSEKLAAEEITVAESGRFLTDTNHRATVPVIASLQRELEEPKQAELHRLFNKLPNLDTHSREQIEELADRLVSSMLQTPMESLRNASRNGTPHGLLNALRRLFQLED